LAQETVKKVKEAEDQGAELIRNTAEQVRQLLNEAEDSAEKSRVSILRKAEEERKKRLEKARVDAGEASAKTLAAWEDEKNAILNPSKDAFQKAVTFVKDRLIAGV